ncbi:hypothetical protein SETIT_1G140500v2 [Setaria italica]|uniref:Uncharacterized protein n=1 Tax=Setaria italica TaxID=4555 RepID=K3Z0L0_SETIT|nr:hypothetical protein SETIT_1G140500v2 [Setaria italica]
MSAIMLCTCSGDQSRFEDIPRSPESLATRDFSANGSSSKIASRETTPDDSQVNEVESDLRETLSLNYEIYFSDAALLVLQGIDIRSLRPRMTSAIAESIKSRVPPRSSRRKTSQVNGMLMHVSMHSVSLLLEAILLKAKSLEGLGRVTALPSEMGIVVPEALQISYCPIYALMDIFHSALEYLPKLWMRSCCFEEAIIAYRRALAKPWNLDSERSANLQKDLAVTLLYCGVEVKFPEEFGQKGNLKLSLQEIKWDPDLVNHLMYALSLSGHHEVLASYLEMLLPGTYTRSERWSILALCNSAAGMDDSALNIIRNGFCNPEIMYSLAWENAMQRKLNAAVENATECLEMVMGGSVSAWKLLILVLSAQQNLQEAEAVADIAIDEAEKDDQLDILRLKAQIQASPKKEVWKSTTCSEVKSLQKLEMDAWLDLASIYTKLEAWHDSNICLDKARSIDFFYPKYWHVRVCSMLEGQSLHQEALMVFSFALSINPDYVPSMVSMAGILRNIGGNSLSNYCLR